MEIKKYKLTDICDFQGGSQPPKKEWSKSKKEGYVRMLQIRDFTQSHKDNVEYVKVSKSLKTCKSEDVLIGRYGASVGKILTGLEGAYNVAIMKTIPNEKILSKKYLLAILKAPVFQNFILSVGVRAAQAGFNKDDLSKFYLYIPSLDNQKRIAKVLFDCEDLIQKRKESIELLDEFLRSTFLEMFGGLNNTKFKTSPLEAISIKITDGTHQSPTFIEKGVPFLLVSNIINNEIDFNTKKFISDEEYEQLNKRTPIEVGDLLFTSVGSYGKAALVGTKTKFAFQRHIAYIKPDKNKIDNVYLFGAMQSDFVKVQVEKVVKGIAQKTLNLIDLKKILIPIPPIELQKKFSHIVKDLDLLKALFLQSSSDIENLYGSISQKAFKGELDLSKVDISQFDKLNIPEINFEDLSNDVKAEPVTLEKLEQIIKSRFGYQEFSIPQIEEILSKQGIDNNTSLVKGFIKDLLSEEKIRTEYSGSTHQVIFKYNK